VDAEAAALAPMFGVSSYDVRMWLTGVLPRIVRETGDAASAADVVAKLRARGHGALACDTRDVVPGGEMVHMHRFALRDREIVANDDVFERLPYDAIAAVVVVALRTDVVRRTPDRAPATARRGPPTVVRQQATIEHVLDRVAYLFPRRAPGAEPPRPWMLHEREAQYLGLGAEMQATQRANFLRSIAILRERAPGAIFDDRFVASPRAVAQVVQVRGGETAAPELSDQGVDVLVHVLATWLTATRGGPYRA
jgi:hypothetical protein